MSIYMFHRVDFPFIVVDPGCWNMRGHNECQYLKGKGDVMPCHADEA